MFWNNSCDNDHSTTDDLPIIGVCGKWIINRNELTSLTRAPTLSIYSRRCLVST